MPRTAANGAVVSDNGQWYFNGFKWQPLTNTPGKKPGLKETAAANKMSTVKTAVAGKRLAGLVDEHGSLEAAEYAAGETEAGGVKQKVVTYADRAEFEAEAPRMVAAGWRVRGQNAGNDHTTVGRVGGGLVAGSVLLPGVGTLVGGVLGAASKRKGQVQVVWERD